MLILIYLIVGCIAGLLAGLFGVGGGLIVVPALIFMFHLEGVAPTIITSLAIGTSTATVFITTLSSAWAFQQKGLVRRSIVVRMVPMALVGSWLGAATVSYLPGQLLLQLFGIFTLIIAGKLWFSRVEQSEQQQRSLNPLTLFGVLVGWLSALFGIGGGLISVPLLRWYGFSMIESSAAAAAITVPMALMGSIAHVVLGWNQPLLPDQASGNLYWPAFIGITIASIPCARLGTSLAHKLDNMQLQRLFALFLVFIGGKFIFF